MAAGCQRHLAAAAPTTFRIRFGPFSFCLFFLLERPGSGDEFQTRTAAVDVVDEEKEEEEEEEEGEEEEDRCRRWRVENGPSLLEESS